MDKQHITDAWINFQRGKKPDGTVVSDLVMRTWMRCREYNISPETPSYSMVPQPQLCQVKQKTAGLITSVHNAVSSIIVPGYGKLFNVVLVTSDGITIYKHAAIAQHSITPTSEGMAFRLDDPGASAVSTCILERTPVIFSGAEHYCRAFHGMHCHAMPIFDHYQNFIAVLSISTSVQNKYKIPPFLPSLIANYVESQNNINNLRREFDTALSLATDASVILDQDYAIQYMNELARKFLGLDDGTLYTGKASFSSFLRQIKRLVEIEGDFHRRALDIELKSGGSRITTVFVSHKETEDGRHVLNLSWQQGTKAAHKEDSYIGAYSFSDIIGESPALCEVIKTARKVAQSNATVLICGETGTGKELLASAIHNSSARSKKPFIAVNCGALSKELILSTLFGYSPGAFTGASKTGQIGKLELADGGTLFLDEIGELPIEVQVIFLRFLQDRIVTRVGSNTSKKVDVRIISATNKDLLRAVSDGTFRMDLFYRLNTIKIDLPALRHRKNDILLLAEYFMQNLENPRELSLASFTDSAKNYLLELPWRGNIRELQNAIARILLEAESDVVTVEFLQQCLFPEAQKESFVYETSFEKDSIISLIKSCNGNIRMAAQKMGCSRSAMYYKLHKYGISLNKLR